MVPSEAREAIRFPGTGQLGTEQGPSAKSRKCFQSLSHFSSPKVQPRNRLKLRALHLCQFLLKCADPGVKHILIETTEASQE